jgi:CHAD domain-containing protein
LRAAGKHILPRLAQQFFDTGETSSSHASGEKLHDFRILTKKFRYTLELFATVYPGRAEEWMREIKAVQSVLGAMNDYRSVQSIVADLGCDAKLLKALKCSEGRKVRQFRRIWAERFSRSTAAQWIEWLEDGIPTSRKPITDHEVPAAATLAARA